MNPSEITFRVFLLQSNRVQLKIITSVRWTVDVVSVSVECVAFPDICVFAANGLRGILGASPEASVKSNQVLLQLHCVPPFIRLLMTFHMVIILVEGRWEGHASQLYFSQLSKGYLRICRAPFLTPNGAVYHNICLMFAPHKQFVTSKHIMMISWNTLLYWQTIVISATFPVTSYPSSDLCV